MSAGNTCKMLTKIQYFGPNPQLFGRWPSTKASPYDPELNSASIPTKKKKNPSWGANVSKEYSNPLLTFVTCLIPSFIWYVHAHIVWTWDSSAHSKSLIITKKLLVTLLTCWSVKIYTQNKKVNDNLYRNNKKKVEII